MLFLLKDISLTHVSLLLLFSVNFLVNFVLFLTIFPQYDLFEITVTQIISL